MDSKEKRQFKPKFRAECGQSHLRIQQLGVRNCKITVSVASVSHWASFRLKQTNQTWQETSCAGLVPSRLSVKDAVLP